MSKQGTKREKNGDFYCRNYNDHNYYTNDYYNINSGDHNHSGRDSRVDDHHSLLYITNSANLQKEG
jgi:hypothetical protein